MRGREYAHYGFDRCRMSSLADRGMTREASKPAFRTRGVGTLALSCMVAIVIAAAFARALEIATHLAQTSDSVQSFVAGHAVARGNILLSGWHFAFDNYYFTDTLPYAAMESVAGPRPVLLVVEPAIAYAMFVCIALLLSLGRGRPTTRNVSAVAAVALLLASPSWIGNWNPLLMSDLHFASVLIALAALWMCAVVVVQSGRDGASMFVGHRVGLLLLAAAAVASDAFSVVFAFVPALTVLGTDVVLGRTRPGARIALILLASGMVLGMVVLGLTARAGGFTIESHVVTSLIPIHLLGRNLIALGVDILALFGAGPVSMRPMLPAILLTAAHALALMLGVASVAGVGRRMFAKDGACLLDRFLCAGSLSVLAACAASAQFGKGIAPSALWTGGPPMRYAMPAVLFASVLAGRRLPSAIDRLKSARVRITARTTLMVLATATVGTGVIDIPAGPRWISDNPPLQVAQWLKARGLTQGVGEYWSANLVTAMSGEAVRVRSVVARAGILAPYVWSSDADWYRQPPQFVIWQDRNLTGLTGGDVHATYAICRTAFVAGYDVALLAGKNCR